MQINNTRLLIKNYYEPTIDMNGIKHTLLEVWNITQK